MNAELGDEPLLYRTRAELRLAELEAIERPLTKAEGADLQRCLHAIYMRNWRLIKGVTGCGGDPADAQQTARVEVRKIAARMEAAVDPDWIKPIAPSPSREWCNQCERMVKGKEAYSCKSQFCKAKAVAA